MGYTRAGIKPVPTMTQFGCQETRQPMGTASSE